MLAVQIQILSLSAHSINTVIDSFGLNQKMAATDSVCDRDDLMEPANPALEINYFFLISSSANPFTNEVSYYRLIDVQFHDSPLMGICVNNRIIPNQPTSKRLIGI